MNVHSTCAALPAVASKRQDREKDLSEEETPVEPKSTAAQRIIVAARQLFAERGFHQTAVADLAATANVSVGAIYRSYASKGDIIRAIVVADSEQMLCALQGDAARVRNGEMSIEAAIEQIILYRLCDKDQALTHEILAEAHRNPLVGSSIAEFAAHYRAVFRELALLARPSLSGAELEVASELLLSCLFGLGHRGLAPPDVDLPTTARIVAQLVMNGLRG